MGLGNDNPQRGRSACLLLRCSRYGPGWILLQYPRLNVDSSSGRPRHQPPAEHVRVRVIDRLPCVTTRIKDNAVTGLRNALGERDFVGLCSYFSQQLGVRGSQARQVRIVRFGDD